MTQLQTDLEAKKMTLVSQLNKVLEKIESYGILDIACDWWPLRDLIIRRDAIKREINEVNKQIEDEEKRTLSI